MPASRLNGSVLREQTRRSDLASWRHSWFVSPAPTSGLEALPAVHDNLFKGRPTASEPDRVSLCAISQPSAKDDGGYCAAVINAYLRLVIGWSIGEHLKPELVADALQFAKQQQKPKQGPIVNLDRGAQHRTWIFGQRLREAALSGSVGKVAAGHDSTLTESFRSSMQSKLFDRNSWTNRVELAIDMFESMQG